MNKNQQWTRGRNSDLSDGEIEDLSRNSWGVDCSVIELKPREGESDDFSGPGSLRQDEEGQLRYKIYAPRPSGEHRLYRDESGPAGSVIPETAFYDLTAVDTEGRKWQAERILPGSLDVGVGGEPIVTGRVDSITCEGDIPDDVRIEGSSLGFVVFDKVKIPQNAHTSEHRYVAGWSRSHRYGIDAWRFRAAGFGFLLATEHKDRLQIRVISKRTNCLYALQSVYWKRCSSYWEGPCIQRSHSIA